jgi:hypothetical protein
MAAKLLKSASRTAGPAPGTGPAQGPILDEMRLIATRWHEPKSGEERKAACERGPLSIFRHAHSGSPALM